MRLKPYQEAALARLHDYLARARITDPAEAYAHVVAADAAARRYDRGYTPLQGLPRVPYCCLRLPTGGGKTLLGAHAVKVAADAYVERERPLVLWLTPSTIIAEQTRDALKDTRHPYRQALDDAFGGAVRVLDVAERRLVQPGDLAGKCTVFVGTMQAFRVSSTEGRLVYGDDEDFEPHFRNVNESAPDLERNIDGKRKGLIKVSFANLLHLWRPVLILDEAHNFVTGLSGDVKQRLNPSCVIEFTATPQTASNTIFAASARELQDAEMIKLPIMLTQHTSWQSAVAGAVAERRALAAKAAADPGAYLRPITLFQAQPATADAEVTVDKLRTHLIENENIPADAIAVATGDRRGLEGIDLKDRKCLIEHVITVAALKEGWDCSFAYVFCSLANIQSETAVEQLLGRVLRQPDATRRAEPALNRAYAHLSSQGFADTAAMLRDKLIAIGFDAPGEAAAMVVAQDAMPLEGGRTHLDPEPLELVLDAEPDLGALSAEARRLVTREVRDGGAVWTIAPEASAAVANEIAAAVEKASAAGAATARKLRAWQEVQERRRAPAGAGVPFKPIPRLMMRWQGELAFPDADALIDLSGWKLDDAPARLEAGEFSFDDTARVFRFELEGEALTYRPETTAPELALDYASTWDEAVLSRWLDRSIDHIHTSHAAFLEWCRRIVVDLIERRGLGLATVVRGRYALKRAIESKVKAARVTAAKAGTAMLFDMPDIAVVEPEHAFSFDPAINPAAAFYDGSNGGFANHYYQRIGELNGDEIDCAKAIDMLPGLKHWVRNGVGNPGVSFSLPTATDLFYPDFVAEMNDGRVLVVEYKRERDLSNDDTREKDNIGKRWAERSGGSCYFVTVSKASTLPPLPNQLAAALAR